MMEMLHVAPISIQLLLQFLLTKHRNFVQRKSCPSILASGRICPDENFLQSRLFTQSHLGNCHTNSDRLTNSRGFHHFTVGTGLFKPSWVLAFSTSNALCSSQPFLHLCNPSSRNCRRLDGDKIHDSETEPADLESPPTLSIQLVSPLLV